ncbi:MAG: hypothetical protein CG437_142 [Methanosaeta sp. NSP1]|nr:MAG: hypothetical protein CG437_142 [Methanosaeta sp. NSP1]
MREMTGNFRHLISFLHFDLAGIGSFCIFCIYIFPYLPQGKREGLIKIVSKPFLHFRR